MSINWKPFRTAPKDRAIYLWSDKDGVSKRRRFKDQFSEYWERVPANDDPGVLIGEARLYAAVYTHWCEIEELEPAGAKKFGKREVRSAKIVGTWEVV